MSDGQAGNGPETMDDLAQFLVDTPDADSDPDAKEEGQPSDEPLADNSEEQTEDAPADEEDDSSEDAEKPPSDLKFKVPVKGEDGVETTVEVDQKELIAGYQRHADYTRKTMELADKEREVTQVVAQKLQEGQGYYLQQAQLARAAVMQLAGLRSPQEMAQLAQQDPATWVAEQQRQAAVHGVLAQLEQGMQREQQQTAAQRQAAMQQEISKAWGTLGQKGIDRPKLVKIFESMTKEYSVPAEKLANVTDPALVLIMADAAAYRELKAKKAEVVKKAQDAPRLPAQRQSVPKNEQVNKRLDAKFASGKAKLSDLAAYIANN
jgi:hypothetical protein